jgi:peptide/nickel transport system substrate-binding protein
MNNNSTSSVFNSVLDEKKGSPNEMGGISQYFGPTERILFYFFAGVMLLSGLSAAWQVNNFFLTTVPAHGGTFTEGVVGSPRFINPLLAISDTDKSLTSLVYSGLLKHAEGGEYVGDLAEHFSVSEDGLIYTVKIRDDATFQDGKPVTAEDVRFTAEKAVDPLLKSPRSSAWEGVGIQVLDEKNVTFVLRKPYAPFLENLTSGILPKHAWKDATSEEFPFSQLNIEPIGSGPFEISNIKYNSSGVPIVITLRSFNKYAAGKPFISKTEIRFFQNEELLVKAFESGDIDAVAGLSPETAAGLTEKGLSVHSYLMPRVFGAFLNQNQAGVLLSKEVRVALDLSIDKEALVNEVLKGYGLPLKGPVPSLESKWVNESGETGESRIESARKILTDAGWAPNEEGVMQKKLKSSTEKLAFSISTSDAPELKKTAEILAATWNKLGASIDVKVFESGDLNQNVIKPRKYDVLLFGEVIGKDLDLYPFWHSSQRIDPGLNIAQFANITADKILDDIRQTGDSDTKKIKIAELSAEIEKDIPTIFTYAPKFIYAISPRIKNINLESVSSQSDRFGGIEEWYIETDKVWNVFEKN